MPRKKRNYRATLIARGVRSGMEDRMKEYLDKLGVKYLYEGVELEYYLKEKGICMECESDNIYSVHTYTPDFYLPDYDMYLETKGRFLPPDRTKHKAVKEYHPDLDIRIVFYRNDHLTKAKKTSYADWCERNNIPYFVRVPGTKKREEALLPDDWLGLEEI